MPDRDRQNSPTEPFVEVCPNTLLANQYWIKRELSRGGWAVVYLAQDRELFDKSVAIKVLRTEQLSQDRPDDSRIKGQFFQEMQALSRIDHPNVVKVLNYGETPGGKLYIVMQYINGVTLDEVIGKDGMDLKQVAYIVRQIGRALTAAHEQGILHCDLKPKNIMLQDYGESMVKLIDFGVARVCDSRAATSMASHDYSGKGTWQYCSPEELTGGKIGEWTDLYAFGVIAYEMITGCRPFAADTPSNLAAAQRASVEVTAKDLRMELPDAANVVLLKALEYDPVKRRHSYTLAHKFGEELAQALEGDNYRTHHIGQTPAAGKKGEQTASPGANQGSAERPPSAPFNAHVLCLGLLEDPAASPEKQIEDRKRLDEIVRRTPTFQRESDRVRSRHSHESLALLFNRHASDAVLCGLEAASELRKHPNLRVRMGAHTGPIFYVKTEGGQAYPIGGGINIAEQVMNCGDTGHILLSESITDKLDQPGEWREALRDLGEHEARPGTPVHFFNLCRDGLGNPQTPRRFDEKAGSNTNGETDSGLPEILTLGLSVSMRENHNEKGAKREKLEYKPDRIGNAPSRPVAKAVTSQILRDKLADLRQDVEKLIRRAREGGNHEGISLEDTAYALAQYVLPNGGMESLVGQIAHPQFDIEADLVAEIPWELLEERFYGCSNGHRFNSPLTYCGHCQNPLQLKSSRLALDYHLTHVARGSGYGPAPTQPGSQSKRFLFIEDPTGEFCAPDDDDETGALPPASPGLDPRRFCSSHLKALRTWAKRAGYQVQRLPGVNAKRGAVLPALRDPDVAAIYFFGHCRISDKEGESYLVLADNRLLSGSEIEQAAPQARFIFLNACEAASTHSDWDLDDGPLSLAHAFAQGGLDKVVIAPIWPVVSVQAAETARRFFDLAWQGMSLGESLKQSRAESHRLFEQGQAHLAWFSYRYFGDPNEKLAHPAVVPPPVDKTEEVKKVPRVFDANGRFVTKVFSFAIDQVLLRAAKRRNLQARELITASDFLAGLVRKGDLTQFVLEESRVDPDKFYRAIYARKEEEAPGNAAVTDTMNLDLGKISREQINALLARWVVRDRKQFAEDLVNALERADEIAQQRAAAGAKDALIAEQDVLESLIACGNWAAMGISGLPAVADVERLLARRAESGIDENGWVSLDGLDQGARKVVITAHRLARQRRLFPIPTRLMLAALLKEKDGFASRVCRSAGVDPKLLAAFMIVMAEAPDKAALRASDSFGLSRKACRRIVLPVIEEAKRLAGSELVTDKKLFQAFCHRAAPQFKQWLSQPFPDRKMEIVETDLDELETMDPDRDNLMQGLMRGLTLRARRVIAASHQLSQQYGMFPISNRLTLAAFLVTPKAFAAEVCRRHRIPDEELAKRLAAAARGRASRKFAMTGEACERVVAPMIERARSAGEEFITEAALFKSFCAVTDTQFKQAMKKAGVDLDALAAEPVTPPKDDPGDNDPPLGNEDAPTRDLDNAVPPTAKIITPEGEKG